MNISFLGEFPGIINEIAYYLFQACNICVDNRNADSVQIFVEDTGSGIPQECLNEIFDRFYKVDTFKQGTGLGLSICKTIVEHLQGDISVKSEIGKGSCFTVTLPFDRKTED